MSWYPTPVFKKVTTWSLYFEHQDKPRILTLTRLTFSKTTRDFLKHLFIYIFFFYSIYQRFKNLKDFQYRKKILRGNRYTCNARFDLYIFDEISE